MIGRAEDRRLITQNVKDIVCCPGGLEVKDQLLKGDLEQTVIWRKEMLKLGMTGFVSYLEGLARGFIEYMPTEVAPFPIEVARGAVLMCYHWEPVDPDDEEEHLTQEKRLIQLVIDDANGKFSGLATLGWDNPSHFPITFLKELGFEEIEKSGEIRLMWLPLEEGVSPAKMGPTQFKPQNLFSKGLLAIESAWSSRCPYSIHNAARLEQVIADLPKKARESVRHLPHRIDTHEEAMKYSIFPRNWEWVFLNGEEIPIFDLPSDKLRQRILDGVEKLKRRTQ